MIGKIQGYDKLGNITYKTKDKKDSTRKNRKPRLPRVGPSYGRYIKSKEWENRKNKYYRNHKRECAKCKSLRYVQLHHMYYDRKLFGNEPDNVLMPLCHDHHKEFHDKYGTHKDMISMTMKFVSTLL